MFLDIFLNLTGELIGRVEYDTDNEDLAIQMMFHDLPELQGREITVQRSPAMIVQEETRCSGCNARIYGYTNLHPWPPYCGAICENNSN